MRGFRLVGKELRYVFGGRQSLLVPPGGIVVVAKNVRRLFAACDCLCCVGNVMHTTSAFASSDTVCSHQVTALQSTFKVRASPDVIVVGPYLGELSNGGDTLVLLGDQGEYHNK